MGFGTWFHGALYQKDGSAAMTMQMVALIVTQGMVKSVTLNRVETVVITNT